MNLLLLESESLGDSPEVEISGRQFEHIKQVLRLQPGDPIQVGVVNGDMGRGVIRGFTSHSVVIGGITLPRTPPPLLPVRVVLGLPRPRVLHRLLMTMASMGVAEIHLLQTSRVEKSYWQTPLLAEQAVRAQLLLGLEQACATQLPKVVHHTRFTPFVEDILPGMVRAAGRAIIAHPGSSPSGYVAELTETLLAIGPEGGFLTQEVAKFTGLGFLTLNLGNRILRTETAVPVALTRLFPVCD